MPQLKQETVDFYFAPQPLTLRSPADKRGHTSDRVPLVQTDNPFAIAPNKASIISNPSNTLAPLPHGMAFVAPWGLDHHNFRGRNT